MFNSDIKKKIIYFRSLFYVWNSKRKLLQSIQGKRERTIFFFITPTHSNLGDQAQMMCFMHIFATILPDYQVMCIPIPVWSTSILNLIHNKITTHDLIFVQSGYKLSDIYNSDTLIRELVTIFKNNKITLLPQTINFVSEKRCNEIASCLNEHLNVTIFCRDDVSFINAKTFFPKCNNVLLPDIVTTLIGDPTFKYSVENRNGVLLCLRNDKEKKYTTEELDRFRVSLGNVYTEYSDTTNTTPIYMWDKNREKIIKEYLKYMSKFKLVITDRYHGTIFSQIVNVPVIVISSTDHKLSTGVKWFPKEIFGNNIFYADSLETANKIAMSILMQKNYVYYNPPYFKETFFSDYKKLFF